MGGWMKFPSSAINVQHLSITAIDIKITHERSASKIPDQTPPPSIPLYYPPKPLQCRQSSTPALHNPLPSPSTQEMCASDCIALLCSWKSCFRVRSRRGLFSSDCGNSRPLFRAVCWGRALLWFSCVDPKARIVWGERLTLFLSLI